jgi:NitT/TauT family transport system substrate-binding protein
LARHIKTEYWRIAQDSKEMTMSRNVVSPPLVLVFVCTLLLAACGGGASEGEEGAAETPSAAGTEADNGGGEASQAGEPAEDLGAATLVLGGKVITWAPAYVGVCEGFFADEGLDVTVTPSEQGTASAIAALVSGDALSAMTGGPAAVNPIREGAPVKLLFNASVGFGAQIVVSNEVMERTGVTQDSPLAERVEALRGETLAILNPGDSVDQLFRYLLPQYGMNPDTDVTLLALSNYTNMLAALRQGEIGGFGGSPPNGSTAEAQGIGQILIAGNEIEGLESYPYLVGSANVGDLENNPERVAALVRGMASAMEFLRENPEGGKPCLREQFPDLDQATFDGAYEFAMSAVPESPLITEEVFQSLADFAEASGQPLGISYEEAVAADFVREALDE